MWMLEIWTQILLPAQQLLLPADVSPPPREVIENKSDHVHKFLKTHQWLPTPHWIQAKALFNGL